MPDLSLSRLSNSSEFNRVFSAPARRASSREFLVLSYCNGLDHCRLGIVIGRKNVRPSVHRNRLKRIIRESFRCQTSFKAMDVVVVVRSAAKREDNRYLMGSLDELWQRMS